MTDREVRFIPPVQDVTSEFEKNIIEAIDAMKCPLEIAWVLDLKSLYHDYSGVCLIVRYLVEEKKAIKIEVITNVAIESDDVIIYCLFRGLLGNNESEMAPIKKRLSEYFIERVCDVTITVIKASGHVLRKIKI